MPACSSLSSRRQHVFVLTNQASAVKKSEIPRADSHSCQGRQRNIADLLLGLRCGGSAHRRIPRELQQQRGHLDVVWNLITDADFAFFVYQLDRCKLSDTHTKSHKLICPGHDAPQSMAYSFTSVCNCLYSSSRWCLLHTCM